MIYVIMTRRGDLRELWGASTNRDAAEELADTFVNNGYIAGLMERGSLEGEGGTIRRHHLRKGADRVEIEITATPDYLGANFQ